MDKIFKVICGFGGALASYLFGGWSALLGILLAFVVIDYVSGLIAAATEGGLSSSVGWRGIAKKISIFFIVAVANLVDIALGGENHIFRDAATFFYIANELLSIIENVGRTGLPVPQKLKNAVQILNEKGDDE